MDANGDGGTQGWPLVGRGDELREIQRALTDRGPAGVVLVGEAGVGKTRLLHEALGRWSAAGGKGVRAVATRSAAAIPFAAVSPLLPPDAAAPEGRAGPLVARVADGLRRRAGRGPLVVGVDDAHLLDEASAGLVHQLAAAGLIVPLLTVRAGEPVRDAVLALWKDGGLRIEVRPLPPDAVEQLLDHALPGQTDPISRRRLCQLVDGNPLLLRELLLDARQSGALRRSEGIWRWQGPVGGHARLADVVSARLGALRPGTRAVLETVACGEPLPLELLLRLAGPRDVEAAERGGMALVERSGGRAAVRLAHPLYGELLRAQLPISRARQIWASLAAALAGGPMRRRDDVLRAGVWELQSGSVRRPDLVLAAARAATEQFDLDLAEQLARAVRGTEVRAAADLLLARILQFRGRGQEAARALPAAPDADEGQRTMWADTRALILYWGLGRAGEAERALMPGAVGEAGRDEAEAARSWILVFDGRCDAALRTARAVLDRPGAGAQAVIWAAMGGAFAAGLLARLDLARSIADRGRAAADAHAERYPWGRAQVGYGLCLALYVNGRLTEAEELAESGYRGATAQGIPAMVGVWSAYRGLVAKARGRPGEAQPALRESVALLRDHDTYHLTPVHLAELAGAAALAGDAEAAQGYQARADALRHGANRLFHAWAELNRAHVSAAGGTVSEAATLAVRAADLARDSQQPAIEAACLYDAARLGAAGAVHRRLAALPVPMADRYFGALAAAAAGLATDEPDALDRAAAGLSALGHDLRAAEAALTAARLHQRCGRRAAALTSRAWAMVCGGACPDARTPLLTLGAHGLDLTHREREVALLAVTCTSRQIADRLRLSVRTVDNHLGRVYAKLGIGNRRELTEMLQGFGADPASG